MKVRQRVNTNINTGELYKNKKLRENLLLRALPYALLISALTIMGLFFGFTLARSQGYSELLCFLLSLSLSLLGFFFALLISYLSAIRVNPLS
ncbi:MAG: hypothetical protein OCU20_03050 [Methanophagales archaeon]|nr:hypothetical protein [Methanophagales archaeon]